MKTLLQVVALAASVGGFQASNVSAERPMCTSNDGKGVGTSIGSIGVDLDDSALISLGSDGYDYQGQGQGQGQGHCRRAMTYALL